MSAPLAGLTPALIDELFDLLRMFGRAVQEGPYLFIAVTSPKVVLAKMSAIFGERRLFLMAQHDEMPEGVPIVIQLDERGSFAVWDDALTVADVRAFIDAVDARMRTEPHAFRSDGRRDRVDQEVSERLFFRSVAATFASPCDLMRVPPFALAALKAQFDQPETLATFKDHFGDTNLCVAAHLEEIRMRDAARARVFHRWGITERADFAALEPEAMDRFLQEFLKELAAEPN